jgi:hypothetical protein
MESCGRGLDPASARKRKESWRNWWVICSASRKALSIFRRIRKPLRRVRAGFAN